MYFKSLFKKISLKNYSVLRLKATEHNLLCGAASTRGTRKSNEDRFYRGTVNLGDTSAVFCAVYDGHGGQDVSEYLSKNLHSVLETNCLSDHGLKQEHYVNTKESLTLKVEEIKTFLERNLIKTFQECEKQMLKNLPAESVQGSTASIAIVQPLPILENVSVGEMLTIAHLGDCRILLCSASDGKALQLSYDHRPTRREEKERIEKLGGSISSDSFGQMVVFGMLACSRSIGVPKLKSMKPDVVLSEPYITSLKLEHHHAFLVIVSDGVSSVMSNQEIVDIVKHCADPNMAAKVILDFAERYGTDDNATAVVLRLDGWPLNSDLSFVREYTQNLRRYKLKELSNGKYGVPSGFVESQETLEEGDVLDTTEIKEQQLDRFVIDLFDSVGKDIGGSGIFGNGHNKNSYVDEKEFPNFPELQHSGLKIGRISAAELKTAFQALQVAFVDDNDTEQEVPIDEVILKIFETVGKSDDWDLVPPAPQLEHRYMVNFDLDYEVDEKAHHSHVNEISHTTLSAERMYHARLRHALSASDILKALKSLDLKVLKLVPVKID